MAVAAAADKPTAPTHSYLSCAADGGRSLEAAGILNRSTLFVALVASEATRIRSHQQQGRRGGNGAGGGRQRRGEEADAFGRTKLGGGFDHGNGYSDSSDGGEDSDSANEGETIVATEGGQTGTAPSGAQQQHTDDSNLDSDMAAAFAASLATAAAEAEAPPVAVVADKGSPGNKGKKKGGGGGARAAPAVKECPVCTFHNNSAIKFCEMCETPLP